MKKINANKFFENQERLLNNNFKQKEESRKISQEPSCLRLKYTAIAIMSVGIIMQFVMLIWFDQLSYKAILWMRGLVGLCAILFVILVAVLLYLINNKSIRRRYGNNHEDK